MAGNLSQYSLIFVRLGSALLTEESQCSFERMSGAQAVMTVAKGFAGMSPGAAMVRGRVSNALPAAGHEIDMGAFIVGVTIVEIGIRLSSGEEATINGFITSDVHSHAVNQEARYEFEFMGAFVAFK